MAADQPDRHATRNATTYCWWCGGEPSDHRIVVAGPGVNICADCIELCAVIVQEERARRAEESGPASDRL